MRLSRPCRGVRGICFEDKKHLRLLEASEEIEQQLRRHRRKKEEEEKAEKTKRRFEPELEPKLVEIHEEIEDGEGAEEDAQRPVLGDTLKPLTPDPVKLKTRVKR